MHNKKLAGIAHYLVLIVLIYPLSSQCFGANFYVSPTGNDANAGTQANPWKTISRVNQQDFNAGDAIYFKGGNTFVGMIYLSEEDAGTGANPVTISSYSSGRATIDGGNSTAIYVYNVAGIDITNINCVGNGTGGSGVNFYTDFTDGRSLNYVGIDQMDISGFTHGISIGAWHASSPGYDDINITKIVAHDNIENGITTWGYNVDNDPTPGFGHSNLYIADCEVYNNTGDPNNTAKHTGNGIVIGQVDGGIIEYCHAHNNGSLNGHQGGGPVGIWAWDCNAIVIQYNVSHDNDNGGKNADGGGFDLDGGCRNSIMQYNYSYNNAGSGYLIAQYAGAAACFNNTICYNLSVNDGRTNSTAGIMLWSTGSMGGIVDTQIYGNTIYMNDNTAGSPRALWFTSGGNTITNVEVYNNLFVTKGNARIVHRPSNITGLTFKGNGYWHSNQTFKIKWGSTMYYSLNAWRNATGQEKHNSVDVGLQADPLLVLPGAIETITDPYAIVDLQNYRLQTGSPMIDAGLDIETEFGIDAGMQDLYGTGIPQNGILDIGSHEFGVATGGVLFYESNFASGSVTPDFAGHTGNWSISGGKLVPLTSWKRLYLNTAGASTLQDYTFEVDAKTVTPGSGTHHVAALMVRYVNGNQYYQINIDKNGKLVIRKKNTSWTTLASTAGTPFAPVANRNFKFEVDVYGTSPVNIDVYVDGVSTPSLSATDSQSPYTQGAPAFESRGVAAMEFDNMKVFVGDSNLVSNGSFENGLTDWANHAQASTSAVNALNGNSAVITANGTWINVNQIIPISGGQTYSITGNMKVEGVSGGNAKIVLRYLDSGGTQVGWKNLTGNKSGTIGWTEYTADWAAPANAVELEIRLLSQNATAGIVRFDDISVE